MRVAVGGEFAPRRSWAVTALDDGSSPLDLKLERHVEGVHLATGELCVDVRDDGRVDVTDAKGRPVLLDGPTGGPRPGRGRSAWEKEIAATTCWYGAGERTGPVERSGRLLTCWTTDEWRHQGPDTDELYVAVPFLVGIHDDGRAFGLYVDSTFRSAFDLTTSTHGRLRIEAETSELALIVLYGPTPALVLERFTGLVGRMRLPPIWSLGYHQSRLGYRTADEVRRIASMLRERRIPADAIHLDIDHMDGKRVFTFDTDRFPDPQRLVADLAAQGIHSVAVVDVGIKREPGYHVYDTGDDRDCFLRVSADRGADEFSAWMWPGRCVFPDFTREDVRAWWGALHTAYTEVGIAGFLNDMNEPAMRDRPADDPDAANTEPPGELPHGRPDEQATHAEVHNVYGLLEDRATDEALRNLRPDERPFVMSRAGFAGVQRYAGVWTGDQASTWTHLEMSLPMLLGLGSSGIAFAGTDIGGFFGDCDGELLVRWTQLGALSPFARNHTADGTADQEPWAFGKDVEDACRRAIELRYRLLPYLYGLFEQAARTGAPILRPLVYAYPTDPRTRHISDQALLGSDLLIAPVLERGRERRDVYLPTGVWYDVRSGESQLGERSVPVEAPLYGEVPLLARGGSVVPSGPVARCTDELQLDPLTLDVFPDSGGKAHGRLYEDDGRSLRHERGESTVTRYVYADGVLTAERVGLFEPPRRTVVVRVHGRSVAEASRPDADGTWKLALAIP